MYKLIGNFLAFGAVFNTVIRTRRSRQLKGALLKIPFPEDVYMIKTTFTENTLYIKMKKHFQVAGY